MGRQRSDCVRERWVVEKLEGRHKGHSEEAPERSVAANVALATCVGPVRPPM